MSSLFTFVLGAVGAIILVPMLFGRKYRHHHRHAGPILKGGARGGGKRGK